MNCPYGPRSAPGIHDSPSPEKAEIWLRESSPGSGYLGQKRRPQPFTISGGGQRLPSLRPNPSPPPHPGSALVRDTGRRAGHPQGKGEDSSKTWGPSSSSHTAAWQCVSSVCPWVEGQPGGTCSVTAQPAVSGGTS